VRFSKRSVEEIKKDVDQMAGEYGGYAFVQSVFLQDADSLLLSTSDLLEILRYLKMRFPDIKRVTSYARAKTLKRKTVEELVELREAGLTRIHVGMESGSEKVLKMIKKGITQKDIVEGGRRVVDAGISLSEYIMPGIGGKTLSEEHARETARLLNAVVPEFIRVRTFAMHPASPMRKMVEEGTFVPMTDEEIVEEIRLLVSCLDKMHSYFSCADFSLNLLMQVDGQLDAKKDWMLEELDRYLALTDVQKKAYSLLRRSTYMQYPIDAVLNEELMKQIIPEIQKLEKSGEDGFNKYIHLLMSYQLPQPQTENWS
jgi:radical SAM superfamily enzyme